jgi:hypothetical protein
MKTIYFDMDGTIANLYGFNDWLPLLRAENTSPYENCEPFPYIQEIIDAVKLAINSGYNVGVITWGSIAASAEYNNLTNTAKRKWLKKIGFPFNKNDYHFLPYGVPKHSIGDDSDILIDDNSEVCKDWHNVGREYIKADEENISERIKQIIRSR